MKVTLIFHAPDAKAMQTVAPSHYATPEHPVQVPHSLAPPDETWCCVTDPLSQDEAFALLMRLHNQGGGHDG